mmetsp:Transcript_65928/g.137301  ORF Transcript_65928/g.137301 Transcript_65928/m.137301 type:complete len:261 (+) Transcript_65928:107-889(+)
MGDRFETRILVEKLLLKKPLLYEIWISYAFSEIKKKFIKHAEKVLLRAFVCLQDKTKLVLKVVLFQLSLKNLSFCTNYDKKSKFFSGKVFLKGLFFFFWSLFFQRIEPPVTQGKLSFPFKIKIDTIVKFFFVKSKIGKLEDIIGITENLNSEARKRVFFKFLSQIQQESYLCTDSVRKNFVGYLFLKSVYHQGFFESFLQNFPLFNSSLLNLFEMQWSVLKFPRSIFFSFLTGLKRFWFPDPIKIKCNVRKKNRIWKKKF